MTDQDAARLALLKTLDAQGYDFTPPTPATHARVLARPFDRRPSLRDIFGWSRPFAREDVDAALWTLLERAGLLAPEGGERFKSRLRVARLEGRLFLHSAFPTRSPDAVFLGPDSYRFAAFLKAELKDAPAGLRLVDIGAGAGVGAIVAAGVLCGPVAAMTDVNPAALSLARVNARHAGVEAAFCEGEGLDGVEGAFDLAIANPPYIVDPEARAYRDGGELLGGELSLRWAKQALARLPAGGRFLLYTGAAIVSGEAPLRRALEAAAMQASGAMTWRELDPDVFGEELEKPAYAEVERIAVVGAAITRR